MIGLLLQSRIQFWPEQDTTTVVIGVILVGAFALILILGTLMGRRNRGKVSSTRRKKYSHYVFQRTAANAGMTKEQVNQLEKLVLRCKVKQPFLIFSNSGLLDDILKKGIYSTSRDAKATRADKDRRLQNYFKIKELIERNAKKSAGIASTNSLRPGQSLAITFPDGNQINTKVKANMRNALVCSVPSGSSKQNMMWKRGTKIQALLWRAGSSGYAFNSKIIGNEQVKGQPAFLIQHSKTLRKSQQRKSRRRTLARNCFFYPIELITAGKGNRGRKRALVQRNFRHVGNFIDISAGGCSIQSHGPLGKGRLLMVEFEIEKGESITAYGKVRRVKDEKGLRSVMHVMFTKVTRAQMNSIYSYVYDFARPAKGAPLKYRLTSPAVTRTMRA